MSVELLARINLMVRQRRDELQGQDLHWNGVINLDSVLFVIELGNWLAGRERG